MKRNILEELILKISSIGKIQYSLEKEGSLDDAISLQAEVLDPLTEIFTDIDVSEAAGRYSELGEVIEARWRKRMKRTRSGPMLKWLCCEKPHRMRLMGRHERGLAWGSYCRYKKGHETGGMTRIIAKEENNKLGPPPRKIILKNRTIKFC